MSRVIQPYQRGLPTFRPGQTLTNMIAGRDMQGGNPQDLARLIAEGNPGGLAALFARKRRPISPYPFSKTGAIPYR